MKVSLHASSFTTFVTDEYAKVVALARALTGSRAIAEDVAQESFAAAHQRWRRVAALDRPDLWVRRVAINRTIGLARRRATERRALDRLRAYGTPTQPEPPVPHSLDDPDLRAAIASLPRRQAELVALVYLDDRAIDDAATVLGITASTARTHLLRARTTLAAALTPPAPVTPSASPLTPPSTTSVAHNDTPPLPGPRPDHGGSS